MRLLAPMVVFSESASWNDGQSVLLAGVNDPYINRGAVQFELTNPRTFAAVTF
jgi:hypothetical protein